MKPDSQKSTTEKLGDNVSQKADHVGSALQPEYVITKQTHQMWI